MILMDRRGNLLYPTLIENKLKYKNLARYNTINKYILILLLMLSNYVPKPSAIDLEETYLIRVQ